MVPTDCWSTSCSCWRQQPPSPAVRPRGHTAPKYAPPFRSQPESSCWPSAPSPTQSPSERASPRPDHSAGWLPRWPDRRWPRWLTDTPSGQGVLHAPWRAAGRIKRPDPCPHAPVPVAEAPLLWDAYAASGNGPSGHLHHGPSRKVTRRMPALHGRMSTRRISTASTTSCSVEETRMPTSSESHTAVRPMTIEHARTLLEQPDAFTAVGFDRRRWLPGLPRSAEKHSH